MSTAGDAIVQSEQALAEDIRINIETLLVNRRIRAEDAWTAIPVSRGTWYNKMREGHWTAFQLSRLAQILDCGIADLFASPSDFGVVQNWKYLNPVEFDGDRDDPTPPVRGHLSPVE